MRSHLAGELLLAETAASAGNSAERAQALLHVLRRLIPFDGAWLALTDPLNQGYHSLASVDLDEPTEKFFTGPLMARDFELTGTDLRHPKSCPTDPPQQVDEIPTLAECPTPAGTEQALAVALSASTGRSVGLLALVPGTPHAASPVSRRRLGRLAPVLARGIDPMRSLVTAARLVPDATAGVVLHADGGCQPLPGVRGDPLLQPRSPSWLRLVSGSPTGRCTRPSSGRGVALMPPADTFA